MLVEVRRHPTVCGDVQMQDVQAREPQEEAAWEAWWGRGKEQDWVLVSCPPCLHATMVVSRVAQVYYHGRPRNAHAGLVGEKVAEPHWGYTE